MRIWHQYGVRAWPTLRADRPGRQRRRRVLRRGQLRADRPGDRNCSSRPTREVTTQTPVPRARARTAPGDRRSASPARCWPTSMARLFIADSNHNRIVICTPRRRGATRHRHRRGRARRTATIDKATVQPSAGHGARTATRSTSRTRRTTCCARVDLAAERVTTVAGTGKQARFRATGGDAADDGASTRRGTSRTSTANSTSPWPGRIRSGSIDLAHGA